MKMKENRIPENIQDPLNCKEADEQLLVFKILPEESHINRKTDHDERPGKTKNPPGWCPWRFIEGHIPIRGDSLSGEQSANGQS